MSSVASKLLHLAVAVTAGVFLASCAAPTGEADPSGDGLVQPQPHPTANAPWDPRGVRFWIAGCNVSEDLWKYREESTTVWCDPRGRLLEDSDGRFDWPIYARSDEIRSLIVEGQGLDSVEWSFWWGFDEAFVPERSIRSTTAASGEVRFDLAGTEAWVSEPEHLLRLRLTWSGNPSAGAHVLTVFGEG